ncbi:MAG: Gldg family protein [Bdellovibrionota bacterium]|nr:Gldg family protein [Bdellovibrionota bacterium]
MNRKAQVFWFLSVISLIILLGGRILIGEWLDYFWFAFCGFFVFVAAAVVSDFQAVKNYFSSFRTRLVLKIFVRSSMLFFILLGIGSLLFPFEFGLDLTQSQINRLDPASVNVLHSLDKETKIQAFFTKKKNENLLENFRRFSNLIKLESDLVQIEILDAAQTPDLTEKYGIKTLPSFVISSGEKYFVLNNWQEDKIINSILRVNKNVETKVCFLEAYGAIPLQADNTYQLSNLIGQIQQIGYEALSMDAIEFLQNADKCDSLILAGLKETPPFSVLTAMDRFLKNQKSVIILQDPGKAYALSKFYKKYGIEFFNDYILDVEAQNAGFHAATPLISKWNHQSSMTKSLDKSVAVFSVASRLGLIESKEEGYENLILAKSSAGSFSKPELKEKIEFFPGRDPEGPFAVAILSEKEKSKLLVVGDSDFITDEYYQFKGNMAFANNMISYMISSKGEISVPPKNFYRELFILTPNQAKYYLMLGVIPMPFLLLGLSIWLWFKRARFQ